MLLTSIKFPIVGKLRILIISKFLAQDNDFPAF